MMMTLPWLVNSSGFVGVVGVVVPLLDPLVDPLGSVVDPLGSVVDPLGSVVDPLGSVGVVGLVGTTGMNYSLTLTIVQTPVAALYWMTNLMIDPVYLFSPTIWN